MWPKRLMRRIRPTEMSDDAHPLPPLSNWWLSTLDMSTLELILLLIREHYELTGEWPTPAQLRVLLSNPS